VHNFIFAAFPQSISALSASDFIFFAVKCVIPGYIILPQLRLNIKYPRPGDRKGLLQIWGKTTQTDTFKRLRAVILNP